MRIQTSNSVKRNMVDDISVKNATWHLRNPRHSSQPSQYTLFSGQISNISLSIMFRVVSLFFIFHKNEKKNESIESQHRHKFSSFNRRGLPGVTLICGWCEYIKNGCKFCSHLFRNLEPSTPNILIVDYCIEPPNWNNITRYVVAAPTICKKEILCQSWSWTWSRRSQRFLSIANYYREY